MFGKILAFGLVSLASIAIQPLPAEETNPLKNEQESSPLLPRS